VRAVPAVRCALANASGPVSLGLLGPAFSGADADTGQVGQHRGGQFYRKGEAADTSSPSRPALLLVRVARYERP
jgi:hypothetical protein